MGITGQNMPQTSNSLLSPTESMVKINLKNLRAARIDELADSNEPANLDYTGFGGNNTAKFTNCE